MSSGGLGSNTIGPLDAELSTLGDRTKPADGVTIFIPNWNHGRFLPRSIRSAFAAAECLEREQFGAEVVVADDASRDGSSMLLRSLEMHYADSRLVTLMFRENLGLARLRNIGLRIARYRYVLLLDADNELVADNAPLFLRSIQATGAAMVYGNLMDMRDGNVVGVRSNELATPRLTVANEIDALTVVDAEALLRIGGYCTEVPGWEDWEMILHLIAHEADIVFVPAVMGYYHQLPLSMANENAPRYETVLRYLQRVYAQTGTREWDPVRVGRFYHPETGWLDESW